VTLDGKELVLWSHAAYPDFDSELQNMIFWLCLFCTVSGVFNHPSQRSMALTVCILYNQRDGTYTLFFIIISAIHVSGGFSCPSSGAYKTVCAALGIVMLSCCLPLVWMGWNQR
jgi:hypothetical protein